MLRFALDPVNRIKRKTLYVLALKSNQGTLRTDVELFAAEQKANNFKDTTITQHQSVNGDHGRIETRRTTAIHDAGWLQKRHNWPGLKGILMVESQREIGPEIETETGFYITSSKTYPFDSGTTTSCAGIPPVRH